MSAMRKICLLAVAVLLLASLSSCGGGSGTPIFFPRGDIVVFNDVFSFFVIDYIEVSGPEFVSFSTFIVPGDAFAVLDLLTGSYTVTIGWTDFTFETHFGVPVFDGGSTPVTGFN